jgi:anti-sigma regulatory factor (Ser/Thr protein kinase)
MADLAGSPARVILRSDVDVVRARSIAADLAIQLGLTVAARARLDLVVAEIATNAVRHAGQGVVILEAATGGGKGVHVRCDNPGVRGERSRPDDQAASLGLGLAVVRELADHVTIRWGGAEGIRVEATVWAR